MLKYFVFTCAFALFSSLLVQAQNDLGFISIDCGTSEATSYIDELSGISYVSDENFTSSGVNYDIATEYKPNITEKQFESVRSFPNGKRNCYTLRPSMGKQTRYLIRARFLYGNYDKEDLLPSFALYIGVDLWDTVSITNVDIIETKEIIHAPPLDQVDVCLVEIGVGVPFISVLELRPLLNETYVTDPGSGLHLFRRINFNSNDSDYARYKDDIYDRLWRPVTTDVWTPLKASSKDKKNITQNDYAVPVSVLSTAYSKNRTSTTMFLSWSGLNIDSRYLFFFHFAELVKLRKNETREFDIVINGAVWFEQLSLEFLDCNTIYSRTGRKFIDGNITVALNRTGNSTLAPIINAVEIYELKDLPQLQTNESDVEAISNIKSIYEVNRISWQGDPCAPIEYVWEGLNCSYNPDEAHRIISLDLSSSGLEGEISSYFSELTMLEYLDLSNNSLSGTVPEFLVEMPSLRVLNIKGNNLTGPIPAALLERSKNNELSLSADGSLIGINETSPTPSPTPSTANSLGKKQLVLFILSIVGYFVL